MNRKPFIEFASVFLVLITLTGFLIADRANDPEKDIRKQREASNDAWKKFQTNKILDLMTDDVHITTGDGTQINGKKDVKKRIKENEEKKKYYVRSSESIVVNEKLSIAWEHGKWKGYNADFDDKAAQEGNYAAMWVFEDDEWKIRSQLFVTLK